MRLLPAFFDIPDSYITNGMPGDNRHSLGYHLKEKYIDPKRGPKMNQDRQANNHTNMMIARLQRELDETKDAERRKEIEKEMNNLRGGLVK